MPLPVSDGDDDSTLNPATLALGDAERTSATECAVGLTDCLAVGTPRLELTAPWMSASCAGDVPNIIYVSEPVPVSWVRWRRAAAVCAAGEVNIFASEPRLVYFGGSENIPRPLAGGSDAGGGDATTRAPVRAKESNPTYSHEHDPGKIPAGGRSRRRPGAFVASSPVAEELGQLERKPKTAATPRTRFPRKRSPARRTRGRARIRRTGLQRRVRSPSIRSSVRGARSRIARFGDARIPTSRPAPVSPVFPLAWTGKCAEAWAGERAFERSASSPLRCEGSSTFARVLACRHRGVSKSEDWRAAVNRVRRSAAQKCLNRGHRARLIFGANCQSVNVSQTVGPITVSRNRKGI